jgi:hypothetical protein
MRGLIFGFFQFLDFFVKAVRLAANLKVWIPETNLLKIRKPASADYIIISCYAILEFRFGIEFRSFARRMNVVDRRST